MKRVRTFLATAGILAMMSAGSLAATCSPPPAFDSDTFTGSGADPAAADQRVNNGGAAGSFTCTVTVEVDVGAPLVKISGVYSDVNGLADGPLTFQVKQGAATLLTSTLLTTTNTGHMLLGAVVGGVDLLIIWSGKLFGGTSGSISSAWTIASVVPLPPSLLLFGSALVGIGFLARRRRAKVSSEMAA